MFEHYILSNGFLVVIKSKYMLTNFLEESYPMGTEADGYLELRKCLNT
jgi:hypothetical protein